MAQATGLQFGPIASEVEEMANIIEGMHSYFWLTSSRLREPVQDDVPYTTQALRQDLTRVRIAWDECQAHRERDAIYPYLTAVFELVAWWAAEDRALERAQKAMQLGRLDLPTTDEPFAAVILCTAAREKVDKRTPIQVVARAAVRGGVQAEV